LAGARAAMETSHSFTLFDAINAKIGMAIHTYRVVGNQPGALNGAPWRLERILHDVSDKSASSE
jgi:hypothetical protein